MRFNKQPQQTGLCPPLCLLPSLCLLRLVSELCGRGEELRKLWGRVLIVSEYIFASPHLRQKIMNMNIWARGGEGALAPSLVNFRNQ